VAVRPAGRPHQSARKGTNTVRAACQYPADDGGSAALDGNWRVDPETLDQPFVGRTALLLPFDRLIHERDRTISLFDFEYVLEMYKPAESAAWVTSPCRCFTMTDWWQARCRRAQIARRAP
jgi:uncharacterized protein YcaQ